jgi:hypothetical protein
MTSPKFSMNENDWERVLKNSVVFSAPALLVFLTQLQAGSSFSDALIALKVWGLSTCVDALRKFVAGR